MGIALLALALVTLLSLLALSRGALTEGWLRLLRLAFGWGAYLTPLMFGAAGIWLLRTGAGREPQVAWEKVVGAVLLFTLGLTLAHSLSAPGDPRAWAAQGGGGGYLGWLVSWALVSSLGDLGAYIAIAALASIAIIILSGLSAAEWVQAFADAGVLIGAHPPDQLRMVTHHHHNADMIEDAIARMGAAAKRLAKG